MQLNYIKCQASLSLQVFFLWFFFSDFFSSWPVPAEQFMYIWHLYTCLNASIRAISTHHRCNHINSKSVSCNLLMSNYPIGDKAFHAEGDFDALLILPVESDKLTYNQITSFSNFPTFYKRATFHARTKVFFVFALFGIRKKSSD